VHERDHGHGGDHDHGIDHVRDHGHVITPEREARTAGAPIQAT
jgi:hypothetical protein